MAPHVPQPDGGVAPPERAVRPSGLNATLQQGGVAREGAELPWLRTSQRRIVPSGRPRPACAVGAERDALDKVGMSSEWRVTGAVRPTDATVVSSLAEARSRPSGLNATLDDAVWP